jgi:hypothetical protein
LLHAVLDKIFGARKMHEVFLGERINSGLDDHTFRNFNRGSHTVCAGDAFVMIGKNNKMENKFSTLSKHDFLVIQLHFSEQASHISISDNQDLLQSPL